MGSQRVGHDWVTFTNSFNMHKSPAWQVVLLSQFYRKETRKLGLLRVCQPLLRGCSRDQHPWKEGRRQEGPREKLNGDGSQLRP